MKKKGKSIYRSFFNEIFFSFRKIIEYKIIFVIVVSIEDHNSTHNSYIILILNLIFKYGIINFKNYESNYKKLCF